MFTSLAAALLPIFVDTAWKGTVLLSAAFALARALRRTRAAYRHAVWALTLAGLLALPVVACFLPSWQISLTMPAAGVAAEEAPAAPDKNLLALADVKVTPTAPTDHMPAQKVALVNNAVD